MHVCCPVWQHMHMPGCRKWATNAVARLGTTHPGAMRLEPIQGFGAGSRFCHSPPEVHAACHSRYMPLATAAYHSPPGTCEWVRHGCDLHCRQRTAADQGRWHAHAKLCVCVFVRVLVRVSVCACVRARVRVHVKCAHAFACLPRLLLSFCAVPRLLHHSRYLFAMPRYHFQSIRATSPCIRWLMRAHASAHGHTCTALFAGAALVPGGLLVPDHKPAQPVSSACLV